MNNKKLSIVVSVDPRQSIINFYSMSGTSRATISHETKKYTGAPFSEDFFAKFTQILTDYSTSHSLGQSSKINLVLPNYLFGTNTISIPTMKKNNMSTALSVAIDGLYPNKADFRINKILSYNGKNHITYSLTLIPQSILSSVYTSCATGKMMTQNITFAANTSVNAVSVLNPKLHNASYLLLDIKKDVSQFVFVAKGRTVGYYDIPFGYNILKNNKVAAEDMLFDHTVSALAVLNAKEKAKAKQLTMLGGYDDTYEGDGEEASADAYAKKQPSTEETEEEYSYSGTRLQKTPRKLPKFMLRPIPETEEEFVYENFRIFVKWALTLLDGNEKFAEQGKPEAVYVNMPSDYGFVLNMVNAEKAENGIEFIRLENHGEKEIITEHLELFGGFYTKNYNTTNNF